MSKMLAIRPTTFAMIVFFTFVIVGLIQLEAQMIGVKWPL